MYFGNSNRRNFAKSMAPLVLVTLQGAGANAFAADEDVAAAEAFVKKSNCTKCRAVEKKKDGPSYMETAGK